MIRSFFSQLWTNIKRSPLLTVLLFIQIVLTAYCLFNLLWSLSEYDVQNFRIQSVYGEKSVYIVGSKPDIPESELRRKAVSSWGKEGGDITDYETFYRRICELCDESDEIDTALFFPTPVYLKNETLPGVEPTDDNIGYYSFYHISSQNNQPDGDGNIYWQLNAYSVDKNYIDIYGLTLESGRLFTDEDYESFDTHRIPVILGASYKGIYSLGDTFSASVFPSETMMTYEVIGFLVEKHVFFIPGGSDTINLFDTYMIIPYEYKTGDEWLEWMYEPSNLEYRPPVKGMVATYFLGSLGISNPSARPYIVDKDNETVFKDVVNTALEETGLDEYYQPLIPLQFAEQTADYVLENSTVLAILVSVMSLFSLAGIVFSAINNTTNNIRSYAIQTLLGATRTSNIFFATIETLIFCVLGFTAGYLWMYARISRWNYQQHPATRIMNEKGLFLSVVFIAVACALTFLFVWLKMRNYSVAELIRGREVKKDGKTPLYRVITFVMFILASTCVTFLTSYIWTTDHIDKYQNNYINSGERYIVLMTLLKDDPPKVNLKYQYEGLDDYSIDLLFRQYYDKEENPKMRAWYSTNGYNIPELTEGRFFTEEEMSECVNCVVVGKNVLEDFVHEKNGVRYFSYMGYNYEVIGVAGREGHESSLDNWVFFSMETVVYRYGSGFAPAYVSSESEETVQAIFDDIIANSENNYRYDEGKFYPHVDIGVEKSVMYYFIGLILISFVVFCIYYIDRILHIMNVKKLIGYSKSMILADTMGQFVLLSVVAYILGNAAMYLLSRTVFSRIALFSAFNVTLPVLAFSFGALMIISVIFSAIAVYRAFRGTARDLRRG